MTYDLTFEIAPGLYRRAATTPMLGVPSRGQVIGRNIAVALLFPAGIFAVNRAFFAPESLMAMLFAAVLGAALLLLVWWRQHWRLVGIYGQYNETAGTQILRLGAAGISAERPHIKSDISWPFVRALRQIDGATLIELPTARLIVPDDALPKGVDRAAFVAQLEAWRTG